ncbi:Tat pathway signal protein [Streptomyces sp. H39-C1]|nr:Tat pathway signal protein [Streptomyces sp. H39-C1]MCZ4102551.1 Tat pathway signal protein [Streptomyces sp. H39-C1]
MARERNTKLTAVIKELGWSQAQVAARFVRVAAEIEATELLGTSRSHVSMWVLGTQPAGAAPAILCEVLSRGLQRPVTPAEIGLGPTAPGAPTVDLWPADTLTALLDLGGSDLDMERRQVLANTAYSAAGLSLPGQSWWDQAPHQAHARRSSTLRVGRSEIEAIREMTAFFSRRDQQRGGGDGRAAVVAYLRTEVAAYLNGTFPTDAIRRELYSAAGELVYLCGWMAFDASQQAVAQRYLTLAVRLAAEADDPPLAGHILRALAHQAVDLGHRNQALDLGAASIERKRYTLATPREKALIGVVHARSLAAAGRKRDALAALLRAENDLDAATSGGHEPSRVFFFSEASLAHETACALRDLGDLEGAQREFQRSVRTRGQAFGRTHAVTLGYLGAVQAQQGSIEAACATWTRALDAMEGVHSGRAHDTVISMRRALSPYRQRGGTAVADLDARARAALAHVG